MKKKYIVPTIAIIIAAAIAVAAFVAPAIIQSNQSTAEDSTENSLTSATDEFATDRAAFKEEYESLNGTTRATDGAIYQSITIPDDAKVKYLTVAEAVDFVKNGTGVLYVGANWCPWCRNAVPELLAAAKAYGKKVVYYLTLDDDKSTYEVQDGQLVETQAGSSAYYQLLEALAPQLQDYTITSDDVTYDTGEKRIYMPYVVAIKDGEILADHTGTVTLDADQTKYDPLTDTQSQELFNTYTNLFIEAYGSSCEEEATTPCN